MHKQLLFVHKNVDLFELNDLIYWLYLKMAFRIFAN